MKTYQERVGRYRILRHDDLPEAHKAAYRDRGIDPDDLWSLIWSFDTSEAAENMLESCQEDACEWETFKLVDNGEASVIERSII